MLNPYPAAPGRHTSGLSSAVGRVVFANVLGDAVLEGLELLEQLVGRYGFLRLGLADQPRSGVDRRAPGLLLGLGLRPVAVGRPGGGLDLVQVDVLELAALLLVVLEASALSF